MRYRLPFVAVVGNDARWNALGGHGEFVDRPEALAGAFTGAVASGRPACVSVAIEGAAAPTFRRTATG